MLGLSLHWIYAHLIGDYILSNDWMSVNKKLKGMQGIRACLIHVFVYMIPFIFTGMNPLQLFLIAIQHYAQDRTNVIAWFCKVTGKFQNEPVKVWGHILVDNIVHILWMAIVSHYLK